MISIPGGSYSDSDHIYRDESGKYVPSITQVMSLVGLYSYSAVNRDILENAQRRGSEVHAIAATYAKYGDVDPSFITAETEPYFEAYKRFMSEKGFVADPDWIETPVIATVHGMKFGATPDTLGMGARSKHPWIVELKTSAVAVPSWSVQTAAQEMAIFKTNNPGRARRMAVLLGKDGRYRTDTHEQAAYDGHIFVSSLSVVHYRLNCGQKLWEVR